LAGHEVGAPPANGEQQRLCLFPANAFNSSGTAKVLILPHALPALPAGVERMGL
jgi:hypothetical protein